jgi:hypothetical protein
MVSPRCARPLHQGDLLGQPRDGQGTAFRSVGAAHLAVALRKV